MTDTCKWHLLDNETSQWQSECGRTHVTKHVTPIGAGYTVCPYCGKTLQQLTIGYIPHYNHYNYLHRKANSSFLEMMKKG